MITAHKIRLNPTDEQEHYFWQAAGVARLSWNWALGEYNRRTADGQKVRLTGQGETLKNEFTQVKRERYPFILEVTTYASQQPFLDLQKAISRYFDLKKRGKLSPPPGFKGRKDHKPFGWPRFKSRNKDTPSFYEANTGLKFDGHFVKFPKIGAVNMAEPLRFEGKVLGARIINRAGRWYMSVQVEIPDTSIVKNAEVVGVDLGLKYLAVTSDGQVYDNPRAFYVSQKKLARLQRSFARMEKGGKNWQGMKLKIAKLHAKIADIRQDCSHKMTSEIVGNYGTIVIEDLNIRGMVKNRHLAKAISDAAMYEKRRQFEYKSARWGGAVVVVDRWFPSSKKCSQCGYLNHELTLAVREWGCPECGAAHNRDENAASNLKAEGVRILTNK